MSDLHNIYVSGENVVAASHRLTQISKGLIYDYHRGPRNSEFKYLRAGTQKRGYGKHGIRNILCFIGRAN